MEQIWGKYRDARHNTFGGTKNSILPKSDSDWVKDKRTYNIMYDTDPTTGVMTNVVIQINLVIDKSIDKNMEARVMVLHRNFKKTPKMTNQVALTKLASWAAQKFTEPQYVKAKSGKVYTYPARERGAAIAWRVANKIQATKKIMNKSGFLSPFTDGRQRNVEKAVDRAVDRFLVGVWSEDVSKEIFKKVDRIIEII